MCMRVCLCVCVFSLLFPKMLTTVHSLSYDYNVYGYDVYIYHKVVV